ncbi:heavy metal translocating P-type ATPase [Kaistia granuli]|uniref:heavy metal translocating P-type ATPase n=1 Tax=Kaistia granuli TaxID=363259 RepID=UPI0003AB0B17|nr:heavy metal translocating P-type ATPase [Kaistia granuli]
MEREHDTRPVRSPIWSSNIALLGVALGGLVAGLLLYLVGGRGSAEFVWGFATLPVLLSLLVQIVTSLRRGDAGLDIIAALSMSAALAFGESLAGNVVALMYAGGQYLENYAEGRARREMTALLGRVARTVMRHGSGGLEEVPIETVVQGDTLLIRQGEVLPVDGTIASDSAMIDTSALTGEALPVTLARHDEALSGTTAIGASFDLVALRPAADSAYAAIVRLVEAAQNSKAPAVRLADRYALWFLALTLLLSGGAWIWTGDPIRALAVLVVATPCPLILAVPVAIIAGISRAAKLGVLIKGGGALEALGRARIAVLDKTGTLTHGHAELSQIWAAPGFQADEILRLAASLDQASTHVMADALIQAAQARSLRLSTPTDINETAGAGLVGTVDGHVVAVGGSAFARGQLKPGARIWKPGFPGSAATIDIVIDGVLAGVVAMSDPLRADATTVIQRLRSAGISRIVLATGDRAAVAQPVVRLLAIDELRADLTPQDKVDVVIAARSAGPVMMVGDGVNDAPALAAADVGVAMGARGAAASSETADVVLLVDRIDRLADAIGIAHRSAKIALQSVVVGLGLSILAMIAAALGYLPPLQGALLQEAIDVAVILNALRALRA